MSTPDCDDPTYWSESEWCKVCGDPSVEEANAYLCLRCKKVMGKNVGSEQKAARFREMCEQWAKFGEFRCHYTGVSLELEDRTHIRYREWDHATPGKDSSVVLCASLVNRMKCYLNAEQFEEMVAALAARFANPSAPFAESAFPQISLPPSPQA